MADSSGIKKLESSDSPTTTRADSGDMHNLKLKEAEKTIANKDVIIKMLQNQVKKLEESYKKNIKETEDFRFKFCMANEQIKRLRSCPKHRRDKEKEIREIKCDMARWKQQCDDLLNSRERFCELSSKCNFACKIKNIESLMKAHYELLQKLVEKMDKSDKVDSSGKIKELEQEIERLKEENAKLQQNEEEIDLVRNPSFVSAKDSLLETYKRTAQELQKKVSVLIEGKPFKVDEDEEEEEDDENNTDPAARKISFHLEKLEKKAKDGSTSSAENYIKLDRTELKSEKCSIDSQPMEIRFGAAKQEKEEIENLDVEVQTEFEELGNCCNCEVDATSEENEKSQTDTDDEKKENQTNTDDEKKENVIREEVFNSLDAMGKKLNEIWDKVMEMAEKQSNTSEEINFLKSEMATSRNLTLECTDNIARLKQTIDDQNKALQSNFQDQKFTTDNLVQMNEKITAELEELKEKIATLFKNVNEISAKLEKSGDRTIEECKCNVNNLVEDMIAKSKSPPLETENEDKSVQIEDIYKHVRENYTKSSSFSCCGCESLQEETIEDLSSLLCGCEDDKESISSFQKLLEDIEKPSSTKTCCPQGADKQICEENFKTSLQMYVKYLQEQLNTIANIENQIEDLRESIKSPQV